MNNISKTITSLIEENEELTKENKALRIANNYNQSLIEIYNRWFKQAKCNIDTYIQDCYGFLDKKPKGYTKKIIITFPELIYSSNLLYDDYEALQYAAKLKTDCDFCGNNNLNNKYNFCPKCGKPISKRGFRLGMNTYENAIPTAIKKEMYKNIK